MSNPNWITVSINDYLKDCPPYDSEISEALIPTIAAEIAKRFDSTEIYNQIDTLCCAILRERGIDPPAPAAAGE
jgi:hypothetical protein